MSTADEIQAENERLRAELAQKNALLDLLFRNNPDGIAIADAAGNVTANPTSELVFGSLAGASEVAREDWSTAYGLYAADGKTLLPFEELPLARSLMKRETITDFDLLIRNADRPDGVWITISSRPIDGGGAISVFRDTTEQRKLAAELARRSAALSASDQEKSDLVGRLRAAVDELSTPVLEVWRDVLAVPIVGVLDTQRSSNMSERVLEAVAERNARFVIVDITGVEIVDTATADHLMKMALAIGLLGCECVLTGVQPAVAQAMFQIGVDFRRFKTFSTLKRAIEYCMDQEGITAGADV